jgi:FlaA1/EpsC-like NDP-sugar epimerase
MVQSKKILIVGAGEAGASLVKDLKARGAWSSVAGFADDDPLKIGQEISGIKVLCNIDDISAICDEQNITDVIIAIPSAKSSLINRITEKVLTAKRKINILFVPSAEKFFDSVPISPSLQEFPISEILDRDEFTIDLPLMEKFFAGKSILITGAGGSIGSEICKQLLKFSVSKIIALGRGENSIYNLMQELEDYRSLMPQKMPHTSFKIADVRDREMVKKIFKEEEPDIVFHAAAHKHVPLMEFNECEALRNNILGTYNILSLSHEFHIDKFILISTDKAVKPSSVMGATKRLCELLTSFYNENYKLNTATVRFGNVLGSRGSVIPLFLNQIKKGGPVTVTHPKMKRYFMSIPEAALLVINAAAISFGGEIFILNMGKEHSIEEIARKMNELYGLKADTDIKIKYTGLRAGEKLSEELFYNSDSIEKSANDNIFISRNEHSQLTINMVEEIVDAVTNKVYSMNVNDVRDFLKKFIPEYF